MLGNLDYEELIDRVLSENHVNSLEMTSFSNDLVALDLAHTSSNAFREWMKKVRANLIQILRAEMPGYFTEDTLLLMDALNVIDETFRDVDIYYSMRKHYMSKSTISSRWDFLHEFLKISFGSMEHLERDGRVSVLYRILTFINSFVIPPEELFDQDIFMPMLRNLIKYFDQDSEVVISCMQDFCNRNGFLSRNLFEHLPCQENYLDFVLFHAKRMRCTYYTLWKGLGAGFDTLDDFLRFFYTKDIMISLMLFDRMEWIPILLKYGFRFQFMPSVNTLMHKLLAWTSYEGINIRNEDALSIFKTFQHRELMALYIYLTFTMCSCKQRKKSLLYISRSDPEPLITPLYMYVTLSQVMIPEYHSELVFICLYYEKLKLYDEDYSIYKPRRLSHLARCATRKRLADNYQLPDGIEDLGLPELIKQYLYLQD